MCQPPSALPRRARGPRDTGDVSHGAESRSPARRGWRDGAIRGSGGHILGGKPRGTKRVRATSHSECPRAPGPAARFRWAVWALSGEKTRTGSPRPSPRTGPADTASPGVEAGRVAGTSTVRCLWTPGPPGDRPAWGRGSGWPVRQRPQAACRPSAIRVSAVLTWSSCWCQQRGKARVVGVTLGRCSVAEH